MDRLYVKPPYHWLKRHETTARKHSGSQRYNAVTRTKIQLERNDTVSAPIDHIQPTCRPSSIHPILARKVNQPIPASSHANNRYKKRCTKPISYLTTYTEEASHPTLNNARNATGTAIGSLLEPRLLLPKAPRRAPKRSSTRLVSTCYAITTSSS